MIKNIDIRNAAKENNLYLWEIAYKLGVSDITFSKWLRKELPEKTKSKIFTAIVELAKEKLSEES